jgi:hypothetical protein
VFSYARWLVGSDGNFATPISNRIWAYDQSDSSWTQTSTALTSPGVVLPSDFPLCSPGECGDGNTCTDDVCNPDLGCQNPANTEPCNDGDLCSDGDLCATGSCQPGPSLDCDPGDPCLIGSCDELLGCLTEPNPACSASVPALSPVGGGALVIGMGAAVAAFASRRRRR